MSIVEAEEDIGEKGSWLGSKDSNLDCMIQSRVMKDLNSLARDELPA